MRSKRASNVGLPQEEVNDLIDKGVSVGSRVTYRFPKRTKQKPTSGIPAGRDVAAAVKGGHITPAEGLDLNRHYLQHMPDKSAVKEPKKKAPRKATKKAKPTPDYQIRVVNGREFKVYNVPQDTKIVEKTRKEERESTRNIYRPKGSKY